MICFTDDTALTRVTKLTDLMDRVFEHIHTLELPAHAESVIDEFEEEYIGIKNPEKVIPDSRPKWPDSPDMVEESEV